MEEKKQKRKNYKQYYEAFMQAEKMIENGLITVNPAHGTNIEQLRSHLQKKHYEIVAKLLLEAKEVGVHSL